MADRWGVESSFFDDALDEHHAPPESVQRLHDALAPDSQQWPAPGPIIVDAGWVPPGDGIVELETGDGVAVRRGVPVDLPLGYHRLVTPQADPKVVIRTPPRCVAPSARGWGWGLQLYAARSRRSWGIGDLADLVLLRSWAARCGASFVAINPMHAPAPTQRQEDCPYLPTSRLFRSPLYLRPQDVPGADQVDLAAAISAGAALNQRPSIDRDEIWAVKRTALREVFDVHAQSAQFSAWRNRQAPELERYAVWSALCEQFGARWSSWPKPLRDQQSLAVRAYRDQHRDTVDFHAWLQWLLSLGWSERPDQAGVINDLAIGVAPDGADTWMDPDMFVPDVTIGAPPDSLYLDGQSWGLAALNPHRLRERSYEPFVRLIRAALVGAAGLRIDHILGLFRLWLIPSGCDASQGAYVRYPADDLLQILALESVRAQAVIVGEDLGMVEAGVRAALASRGVLSTRVLLLDDSSPKTWPPEAVASVSTHDLPTVAGLWTGTDLADQRAAGARAAERSTLALRDRLSDRIEVSVADDPRVAITGAYRALAEAPCLLLSAALEDALATEHRPNLPGTDRPENWTMPLPVPIEDLDRLPGTQAIADILGTASASSTRERQEQPC